MVAQIRYPYSEAMCAWVSILGRKQQRKAITYISWLICFPESYTGWPFLGKKVYWLFSLFQQVFFNDLILLIREWKLLYLQNQLTPQCGGLTSDVWYLHLGNTVDSFLRTHNSSPRCALVSWLYRMLLPFSACKKNVLLHGSKDNCPHIKKQ